MQVFWSKGYEAASLDDLCEGTGLNRSSLYAAFGDKHALFARHDRAAAASVRRNLERVEATFRSALVSAKARSELPPDADVGALARFLVASIQGLRLIGKTGAGRDVLEDVAGVMLRCLD